MMHADEQPPRPKDEPPRWSASQPKERSTKTRWIVAVAVLVLALAGGVAAWLVAGRNDNSSPTRRAPANSATVAALQSLPKAVGHPVYWAGPRTGYRYELTHTSDGRIYIRYLPAGVAVGTSSPNFLTIGTYPVKKALATVKAIGAKQHGSLTKIAGGGFAAVDPDHPLSTYVAYRGSDYEVEVFDSAPGQSLKLVTSGGLTALGAPSQVADPVAPETASLSDIQALARVAGHSIYWAGPESGVTYELSELKDGRIFVRYLPAGVDVADPHAYQTIGTYPVTDAFAAVTTISQEPGATTLSVPNGGIATVDPKHPTSVYIAFRGSKVEIEVFAPSPKQASQLVTSGAIVPVRP
jgi:hypothetical protein